MACMLANHHVSSLFKEIATAAQLPSWCPAALAQAWQTRWLEVIEGVSDSILGHTSRALMMP